MFTFTLICPIFIEMAICIQNVKTILTACKQLKQKQTLLILGDAVIFFSPANFQKLAKEQDYPLLENNSKIWDCYAFGKMLGFESVETLDINGKTSIHFNLHDELPPSLLSRFDAVIDAGVLYWCFDPATAIKNIFRMVKKNGAIVHSTALSGFFGRGYYNIHPKTFEDFYRVNHSTAVEMSTYTRDTSRLNAAFKLLKGAGRIQRWLGVENSPVWTSLEFKNNFFIDSVKTDQLSFGATLKNPEPRMIPNNVIGTFAFIKNLDVNPVSPSQTT